MQYLCPCSHPPQVCVHVCLLSFNPPPRPALSTIHRLVFLSDDLSRLCWTKTKGTRYLAKSIPLDGLIVKRAPPILRHKKDAESEGFNASTFSIILPKKMDGSGAIDLRCISEADCDEWTNRLSVILEALRDPSANQKSPRELIWDDAAEEWVEGPRPYMEVSEGEKDNRQPSYFALL